MLAGHDGEVKVSYTCLLPNRGDGPMRKLMKRHAHLNTRPLMYVSRIWVNRKIEVDFKVREDVKLERGPKCPGMGNT